jgi:hypothetical protein
MFNKTFKTLALVGTLAAASTFVGCLQGEDATASAPDAVLNVSTSMDAVDKGGLGKSNVINYKYLIIRLASNATVPDVILDTVYPGEQTFTASSATAQNVDSAYTVKGLRSWKITATVYDTKDSVIHRDSSAAVAIGVATATATATLNLTAKFTMYEAKFNSLPARVRSSTGPDSQLVTYKRLLLFIDGTKVADSTHATSFAALGAHSLFYDYVAPGVRTVRLVVMGSTGTTFVNDTLFSNVMTVTSTAGNDSSKTLALAWRGPNVGVDSAKVTVGRVGKTTVEGTTTGVGAVPKNRK